MDTTDTNSIVSMLNSEGSYPVSISLPVGGPNGSEIKWNYVLASGDIIMDSSYVDGNGDGYDDDGELEFDDAGAGSDFSAEVSYGSIDENVYFVVSYSAGTFTITEEI